MEIEGFEQGALEVLRLSVIKGGIPDNYRWLLEDKASRKEYLRLALANRILLHAMDLLKIAGIEFTGYEETLYTYLSRRYSDSIETLGTAVDALEGDAIDYAVIKSIRSYRATTVDIDILLINGRSDLSRAYRALKKSGFKLYASGPGSLTLTHPVYRVSVDLYVDVSASRLQYCQRDLLREYVSSIEVMLHGSPRKIRTIDAAAEFLVISAHSLVKEQMFTLADYLMLRERLLRGSNKLKSTARALSCMYALDYGLTMMARTHEGSTHLPMKMEPGELMYWLAKAVYEAPYLRKSLAWQVEYIMRPAKAREFTEYLLEHLRRSTY